MAEQRADRSGQALGPYQLTRLLGAGGFGEVYEADHRLLQQKRAIKLLLERHFHDPNQRERFLREARTLAALEHLNILSVLEVGEEGSMLYLVMPFYRRGTLNDLLKQRTMPLPLAEVERLLAQICAAVGYAHARHIAHLDLKPDNMLLHEDGRLVLSDFGLAHLIKQGRLEAGSSASWGTPYYMAPEQIRGEPELHSDLYALGVILYQLLTNQRPFMGTTPEAVMMKHLLEAPPPLHAVYPEAPVMLEPVVQKALEKKPEDRYATAEALLADFRAAVGSLSSQAVYPTTPGASFAIPRSQMNNPTPILPTTNPVPPEHAPHTAEPATMMKATGAGCEIELNNGYNCGVTTRGRCATCGRAFCLTHQAHGTYRVDWCLPCQEMEYTAKQKKQEEMRTAEEYFSSGSARATLLASRVQPVDIHQHVRKRKNMQEHRKGFFGKKGAFDDLWVDEVICKRGWILGEFTWGRLLDSWLGEFSEEKWLTALLDVSPGNFEAELAQAQPYSEGYEVKAFGKALGSLVDIKIQFKDWSMLAEAVRRLAEASN